MATGLSAGGLAGRAVRPDRFTFPATYAHQRHADRHGAGRRLPAPIHGLTRDTPAIDVIVKLDSTPLLAHACAQGRPTFNGGVTPGMAEARTSASSSELIRKSGNRFSEKIMLKKKERS